METLFLNCCPGNNWQKSVPWSKLSGATKKAFAFKGPIDYF